MFLCGIRLLLFNSCHHLNGLELRRRIGMSWWLSVAISGDYEGSCTFPGRAPKGNSCKLLVSLSYLTCGSVLAVSYRVDEVCKTPLSRRTTKCWSTQRGRSVLTSTWTSGENRLSLVFGILPVIGYTFILWLVHPLYVGIITLLTFTSLQTSWYKLFSVIRIESLLYLHSSSWALSE